MSKAAASEEGAKPGMDGRVQWISDRLAKAVGSLIKGDKFAKLFQDPENITRVEEFLNNNDVRVLTFVGETIQSMHGLPKKVPRGGTRVVYFLKTKPGPVAANPAEEGNVLVGDMTAEPLEHLERVLSEVFIPLLSNPVNQEGWGEVASKDIMDRLHTFLANVSITVGQTKGETCLPLPPMDASTAAHISSKERTHLLEGAVITWTKQIKAVLKQDPEAMLRGGSHPIPEAELEFWKHKAGNLNAIFSQLQSERIRRVLQFLDASKSTYCTPFAKLCKEVFAARLEANDNVKYLRTLESWFQRLNGGEDFEKLPEVFRPILHILLLIWKNSKFYNTPARLVVLVREICNAIISQALKFISGKQIFEMIAEEQAPAAVAKLRTTLKVCGDFKRLYFAYKATANAECPSNPWRIQNTALFLRLDAFLERCHDVLEMTQVIVQFSKLEKIVIGGTKGAALTATLNKIYADFKQAVGGFEGVTYDLMDVERKEFDEDFHGFRARVKELERRLVMVLTQAFDDCVNIYARFKLLDSFDSLLERPLIQDELERKHISLVQAVAADLKKVQEIFLTEKDNPPISWNMPPIAGALYWCRGLKERLVEPMVKIRQLSKDIMNREEAKEVLKVYTTVMSSLDEFEHSRIEEWGADVERSSQAKLKLPLLVRMKDGLSGGSSSPISGSSSPHNNGASSPVPGNPEASGDGNSSPMVSGGFGSGSGNGEASLLQVNFDPALVRLLREVKYFLLLGLEVPAAALEVYKKAEIFRRQTGNLDLLVNMYNTMMIEMLPVEAPLLRSQLLKIDQTLVRGLRDLNWKSAAIDVFITEANNAVKAAYEMLFQLKGNLRDVVTEMEAWSREPLLTRKSKPMSPEEFEATYKTTRTQRYAAIAEGGKSIDKRLKDSAAVMKIPKGGTTHWNAYVDFVNGIVVQGLARLVVQSLRRLVDVLSPEKIRKNQDLPLLIIDLNLAGPNPGARTVRFTPDVVEDSPHGASIYDIVNGWVDSFYHAATMFKRLDDNEGKYVKEMVDDLEVQMLLATLNDTLARTEQSSLEFRAKYEAYSYLWKGDMQEAFKAFCDTAYIDLPKTDEQVKAEADMQPEDIPPQPKIPDLQKFDAEITKYRELGEQIAALKTPQDIGWLRVNTQPIKNALSSVISAWIGLFTAHLQQFVSQSVSEMHDFITNVQSGLEEEVSPDSKDSLRRCMTHIRDVRKTRYIRKAVITPLRKAVTLLKKHGAHVDDIKVAGVTASEYLEQADLKVEHTINKTFAKKETIFPLQTAEMEKIKVRAVAFEDGVRDFWNGFRKNAPFSFTGPVDQAYSMLDGYYNGLVKIEHGAKELNEIEELFELPISKFSETGQCRTQLKLLKQLWDFKALVLCTYDAWKTSLWADINTDALEDANKKMAQELKKLGDSSAIVKAWNVYKDIDVAVRDMSTTLPLVNELHSPAMRPRHWKELARVCGVKSLDPTDPKFSLEDLVELKLHTHKEEVEEIVDTANKEQKIEKKMDEIEGVWRVSQLDYIPHKDGDVKVVRASDEIMENLDAHQMELQSIVSMGKVMEFFRDRVEASQRSLGIVEEVLKEWLSVTKAWASLESIFLASADIRAQLPDDTKRFEGIDSGFKELMKSAVETPNVVEACTKEGRGESLKEMTKNLELCQKSLNDYLDTKKKIFPRFYFVSNVALLDILSNGNNPPKIMQYVGDCYDSIANLEFDDAAPAGGEAGKEGKEGAKKEESAAKTVKNVATKMIAKDGEIVEFYKPFVMLGAVERWLNDLTIMQQDSLRFILEAGIETAVNWEVEKPRHLWLEDYPAQIVLVGTQIYWTEETQAALDELEGGQEDAVKKYLGVCNDRLTALINRVLDPSLAFDLRTKIISLITLDVHSRDVVQKLIDQKAEGPSSFIWSQQLRFYWAGETKDVNIAITDFRSKYFYEWVGNSGRLVITPLTDRCYITLTLALRLFLGGAPAGPAGTGKTETTKDLARSLALPCYVFNCVRADDHQLLTNRGFMFLDEVETYNANPSNPPLLFASYDEKNARLVYEQPLRYIVNKEQEQRMVEFTQSAESQRWLPGSDVYGRTNRARARMDAQRAAAGSGMSSSSSSSSSSSFQADYRELRDEMMTSAGLETEYDPMERENPTNFTSVVVTSNHNMYARTGTYTDRTTTKGTPTLNVNWDRTEVMPRSQPRKFEQVGYSLIPASKLPSKDAKAAVGLLGAAYNGVAVVPLPAGTSLSDLKIPAGAEADFLELYGYWCGDGTLDWYRLASREVVISGVGFHIVKPHDSTWLKARFARLKVAYTFKKVGTRLKHSITDSAWVAFFSREYDSKYGKGLRGGVSTDGGDDGGSSVVPENIASAKWFMRWVWCLDAVGARHVLDGLRRADGAFAANHNKIWTSSARFRDEILRLCLHAGYSPAFKLTQAGGSSIGVVQDRVVSSRHDGWEVVWGSDRKGCEPVLRASSEITAFEQVCRTWCVTMPSGFIIARRAERDADGVVMKASRPLIIGNCSDQMTYQTLGDIFKGLAQTGAWGCFDEFNRINIEVLSVVATQVKSILDACVLFSIPANRLPEYQSLPAGNPPVVLGQFELAGDTINLIPTVGLFITMNPGYAGRTELPENLKALFRSCAMIRPDLALICENMLMSEGFQNARPLSIKFVTLYQLASELLSPQAHYDWGLRAVKSVLRVAGALKRGDPEIDEEGILMRALRDFNTPKMPTADLPIFLRLIQDLFPRYYQLATKLRQDLFKLATQACKESKPVLQHDHGFVAKVVQLQDLMDVRHSVMLVGPAGCGKTTVWKTLAAAHNLGKPKNKAPCIFEIVDPKAVTSNELYGYMTLSKEWKDGVLSIIMRGMSKNFKELGYSPQQTNKWVVLDGDIDAVWIESMNTVMDDNKVLTLVSNERIPLSPAMRMVFEVNSLANATPATVSRAGILFINDTDIGWRPYVDTWIACLPDDTFKAHLPGLFDKYIEAVNEGMRKTMKTAVPLPLINQVMSVCRLLDTYLDIFPKEGARKPLVENLEHFFFTAVVWAFGGSLIIEVSEDGSARGNHRLNFHGLISNIANNIKLPKEPDDATCFDFFYNPETEEFEHWKTLVPEYTPVRVGNGPGEMPFSAIVVPTVDSTRLTGLLKQLVNKGHPVMFVGNAGTGKTTLVKSYLSGLDDSHFLNTIITMNYYMDSAALQARIDGSIDKRSGRLFGPPTGKKMVFYVDDMNLPYLETYGTQNSLSLLRQIMDHRSYFDRADLGFRKEVTDCLYIASMNPTAGSFTITERLQRLHTTFSSLMPSDSDLNMIFKSILSGHLRAFQPDVAKLADTITEASIKLHKVIVAKFLPDAERFMYNWNMRELANVFQGLCAGKPEFNQQPAKLLRLWLHEIYRVFSDRMVDAADAATFDQELRNVVKATWKEPFAKEDDLFAAPLIFTSFAAQVSAEPAYLPLPVGDPGVELLSKTLIDRLEDYNSSHSIMDLVLFEEAMQHVCRICRIISNPGGNAMLIGVGGSGKQSLSKLSAHICGYDVRQLQVTARFTVVDLKENLKEMYKTAGVKGQGLVFLLNDSQIVNDKFLVYVNDILASGWIADLFERDEIDGIFGSLRNEAKAAGIAADSADEMLKYFIAKVRSNLHLILCFSPVGATFRIRARRFPGLINCTVIDKFHAWPKQALISVASRFIDDLDLVSDTIKTNVALHMAEVHTTVTSMSDDFKEKMRRYNYVTPKSFLELIAFYRYLLGVKREASGKLIKRLDDGLAKLKQTAEDVAELKKDVQRAMLKSEEEVRNTDILVEQISKQRAEAEVEKEAARVVAEKATAASNAASKVEKEAEKELAEAKPALERAQEAVKGLSKASLTELKNFNKPPSGVEKVTACCLMMLEGEFKNHEKWDRAKKMMSDVGGFLGQLEKYDARTMTEDLIAKLEPYVQSEGFTEADMRSKSAAAANLCSFVVNLYTFNRIYVKVKPLMDALEKAQAERQEAQGQLDEANGKVARLEANLAKLEETLVEATNKKQAAEKEAERCSNRLSLANRLVNGLSSENDRWAIEVDKLRQTETMLIGDVLLASAFVSYIGAFNNVYRKKLWQDTWIPDLLEKQIPLSDSADPLAMLTDEGKTAKMMNEGLPADRISIENGSIINASKRWPLIIDPQLQGVKWLRGKFIDKESRLNVVQLTQPNWLKAIISAIQQGTPVIIENVGEDIDATIEPVLARAVYNKGRTLYLRVAGEEVEFDARFKLYLQTKLPNPHYRPEIQAQCTLINFIATESGLQDQLLARVVNEEKKELEERKQALQEAFNQYKMQLLALEDDLLTRLANAPEDILSDVDLILGLEATKAASTEITAAVAKGKQTEIEINEARQVYVPVAEEGAMLYFMISALNGIEHMYQYSLDSFMLYFYKAIREAPKSDDIATRVQSLKETLRLVIFTWVYRGLFERHKLILLAQLTFQLMSRGKLKDIEEFNYAAFQFLLRGPKKVGEPLPSALDWLPEPSWNSLQALAELEGGEFAKLPADLSEAPTRFKEWFNHVTPESEKLPLDWSALDKTPFKKLLVLRSMRPDRLNVALREFVRDALPNGPKFVDCDATLNSTQVLEDSLHDSNPSTPIYFILSPGADVVSDVDKLALKHGYVKGQSYHNVSMGQGQDVVAMEKLEMGHKQGHWVLLNNVHLMPRWLVELEKKIDAFSGEGSNDRFRIFLTSETSPNIPIGILNRSIKLTNEPPQGLKNNLKRAFCSFSPEYINEIDTKMRAILFGLCHFHAVMIERKKFGSKGFNMMYPFSLGDLRDSAVCLQNYMENASGKIPWDDLRYIFGQIMYGGHIVNDFDRLLCVTYLEHFLRDELLDEMELFPYNKDEKGVSFKSPSPTTADRYLEHIETEFKGDTPIAFGLHPNAEIGFRTEQSETLLRTLLELQPRDSSSSGGDDKSPRALAGQAMGEFLDAFGETHWDVDEIQAGMEEVGPFQNVLILELKQMAVLLTQIRRSLATLRLGFDGKLTMSEEMEKLETELSLDKVPTSWTKLAWPSMRALASWKHNLVARVNQLNDWVGNPMEVPKVTWLSGLINPQSFLTAIKQQTAQRTGQELDKLTIQTEVTKRMPAEVDAASKDGCFITGLSMQGARFDIQSGVIDKSKPREMYCEMPVINCKSVAVDKLDEKGVFQCPVYKTEMRGPTFVFMAQLRTKSPPGRWVMAGVALIMDVAM